MLPHFNVALHGALDNQIFFTTNTAFDGDPFPDGGFFITCVSFLTDRLDAGIDVEQVFPPRYHRAENAVLFSSFFVLFNMGPPFK